MKLCGLFIYEKALLSKKLLRKRLRNLDAKAKKAKHPELFCSKEMAEELKIRRQIEEEKQIERDKYFYLEHAEKLNYYLKKKVKYRYRKPERDAFIEECKMRSGGVATDEEKKMLEYIDANYDDYFERRDKALIETGEVIEDTEEWVCLPMYKYFPLYMSVQDMKMGKTDWRFAKR